MTSKVASTAVGIAALASSGFAQLTSVSPFTGTFSDGFELNPDYNNGGHYNDLQSSDGFFTFTSNPGTVNDLYIYNPGDGATWGLGGNGYAAVNSGVQGLGFYDDGVTNPVVTLTFAAPVMEFGGYFAGDDASSNLYASFFDQNGAFLGQENLYHPGNSLVWSGFQTSGTELIGFVQFSGNLAPAMDDLQASPTPEPMSLAFLGLGSLGLLLRRKR